jgi:prepilin-type N-terminal cleavage/methylation domain-containing protein
MNLVVIKAVKKAYVASKKAFTLIELLVVIAIIALLLAILLPSLSLVKQQAKDLVCRTNVRRIGVSLNLYALDCRGYYPRALPLNNPDNHLDSSEWEIPWPSNLCPWPWQAGYPSLLAPYLTDATISNPFDYFSLPSQMPDSYIKFFSCPGNKIPITSEDRKCNYPLDYGLHNLASQNRQTDRPLRSAYLVADQTWGMAFVSGSGGPNDEPELQGWWTPFVHPKSSINVLLPDLSVEHLLKNEFIMKFKTANPPDDLL